MKVRVEYSPVEVHGNTGNGSKDDHHLDPVPELFEVAAALLENFARFLHDEEDDEDEERDFAQKLESERLLVVSQQVDAVDSHVRSDATARQHFRYERDDAEEVDVGVVDAELDEDGSSVFIDPFKLLQFIHSVLNDKLVAFQLEHVAPSRVHVVVRPVGVRLQVTSGSVLEFRASVTVR